MASELLVNKITPESGTTLTLGDSGDTISFASGVLPSLESLTVTGDLTVDTDTLYVDSTNDRVGVGTTSPSQALDVQGNAFIGGVILVETTNNNPLQIESTDAFCAMTLADTGGSVKIETSGGVIKFETGGDASTPGTNASEAMRIDSSGNVLIGKTTLEYDSNAGTVLRNDGFISAVRSGGNVTDFNRLTSDGEVVRISKDGTTTGGIYTTSSGISIRLGGTGTANELDDYEEGTWTPSVSSGTITVVGASYTKVGRLVTVNFTISTFSDTTSTSGIGISGLPFTSASGNGFDSSGSVMFRYVDTLGDGLSTFLNDNTTSMQIYMNHTDGNWASVKYNNLNNASMRFIITHTYQAA